MASELTSWTVNDPRLGATTLDLIQPDLTITIGEASRQGNSVYYKEIVDFVIVI